MDFFTVMDVEVSNYDKNDRWEFVRRDSIGNTKVIKSIWVFKNKKNTDGSINKYKVRICAHGGMQRCGEGF